ncbi:MAG: type II secretion system minor pseudopilin GspH [Proteobacteria bacterium]|nr:type II secretion system minor pseudopilin GspH [Pseudomonadota bacterium]
MPISATKTCRSIRHNAGFSLIELLVVVSIAGVLLGVIILGFTGADREQDLRGIVERMTVRIEMARQYSLQRNREWGIYIDQQGYRFAEFNPDTGEWVDQTYKPFLANENLDQIFLNVNTEGFDPALLGASEKSLPQIILFSSGEVTPFSWTIEPDWDSAAWIIRSDGLSAATAERKG